MVKKLGGFYVVSRPPGISSKYTLIVVDGEGKPHLPLTRFYKETQQALSDGTARTYLNTLLPYFTYLSRDEWRRHREDQWNSAPEAVQESVRDYLVHCLHCKIRRHDRYELVNLTGKSPNTVRLFLAGLKQFYSVMQRVQLYLYAHPLTDSTSHVMREIERGHDMIARARARMPQMSGVEEPVQRYMSENYFRLCEDGWVPQPIDDPNLHQHLLQAARKIKLKQRDQIVIRIAYESGARISEILGLTIGDWRKRGYHQEAAAFSKGSRGRRVKVLRFSSATAKMLREYVNIERCSLDCEHRRLEQLTDSDPLFLSERKKPYSYEAFKPHWYAVCRAAGIDLNIHHLRHWNVTQAMRVIVESSQNSEEVLRRKEELVRYMAWRSPETLKAYEHYFQAHNYAKTQDLLLQRLNALNSETTKPTSTVSSQPQMPASSVRSTQKNHDEYGWETLFALEGGKQYGEN